MKKLFFVTMSLVFMFGIGGIANATNGDNFMGIGPISRAMGGVGVAAPQDSISAVFANPAGMCFGPYCPGSQLDFGGTVFLPTAHGSVRSIVGIDINDRSQSNIFLVPAIGVSTPITSDSTSFFSKFRFGLAAYGSSGLGVDYRNLLLFPGGDIFTQYSVFKFAPNIAYRVLDNLSIGVNFQLDYTALDLGQGTSSGFGFGGQVGAIYKLGPVSFGLSYVSPQSVEHKKVSTFGNINPAFPKQDLKLEMPQTVGFGIAFQTPGKLLLKDDNLLIEGDFKWINWANARGYKDFAWRDQYVFGLGLQYKPIPRLALRLGVNYGKSPVKTHNGFDGATTTVIQGIPVNTGQYEYLRVIGFPALVETHLTCGIGYDFSERFGINIGYTHGFAQSISESGINFGPGFPVTLGSKLAEDSIEAGLSWRF
jgi:long-chain fatty acid transport protein